MNWDVVQGNWKQMVGKAKERWGDMTDNDWERMDGRKDQLTGAIQEKYGITRDEANRQIDEWATNLKDEIRH